MKGGANDEDHRQYVSARMPRATHDALVITFGQLPIDPAAVTFLRATPYLCE